MLRRCGRLLLLMTLCAVAPLGAQANPKRLVIAVGQTVNNIVPGVGRSSVAAQATDLVFLRLGRYGGTSFGDHAALPELAKSWTRRDSLTLVFDLDPRARWHDGTPVTSRDIVFSFTRARNPKLQPSTALLLTYVQSVEAEGDDRVVIRFSQAYGEQLYDAAYQVHILPAHLLASIPPDSVATSAYAHAPVGTGPYQWDKLEPTDYLQLRSFPGFFLGTPAIEQIVWRFTSGQDTRLNMLLSGEADVQEDLIPPLANISRLPERPSLRVAHFPSMGVTYLLFNQRSPTDSTQKQPHPLFADPDVRRAISMAIDRSTMTRALYGKYATPVAAPAPSAAWFAALAPAAPSVNQKEAIRLLASRGWKDSDGDGILDRNGVRLAFNIIIPNSSVARVQSALIVQQQLKKAGIQVEVVPLDVSDFLARRRPGNYDAAMESFNADPSPWSLIDRWGCGAEANYTHYCNRTADSLLRASHLARRDPAPALRAWFRMIADDFPAAFLYSPDRVYAIPRYYDNVTFQVESPWQRVWTWTLAGAGH